MFFKSEVEKIYGEIENNKTYIEYFHTTCRKCDCKTAVAQNFKWEKGQLYEVGVECSECNTNKKCKYLEKPTGEDIAIAKRMHKIQIETWCPDDEFYNSPSFTASFVECIGGKKFANLWTRRNLFVISSIFNKILLIKNKSTQTQLLLGFIKTIHLCTKMNVPRRENAARGFSTSWGRSAYICASRTDGNESPSGLLRELFWETVSGKFAVLYRKIYRQNPLKFYMSTKATRVIDQRNSI